MKKNILVLCTGNSCRSQMAEGYLRHFAGEIADVYSAGLEAHGLNPRAVHTMAEDGINISGHTSDTIDRFRDKSFDFIITVCDHANEHCPFLPGTAVRIHQSFPDPARATGNEAEIIAQFRAVRDQIRSFSESFIRAQLPAKHDVQ